MRYYYLISSLAVLEKEGSSISQEQLEETLKSIQRNLTEDDARILQCLLYPADNQNLLYILFHEYHDFEIRSFVKPCSIATDVLKNYRREYPALPDYMINYLNDLSGSFSSMSLREMEQVLDQFFQDYVLRYESTFLNTYFAWKTDLERTIAEINVKSYPFLHTRTEGTASSYSKIRTLHSLTERSDILNQLLPLIEAQDLSGIEAKVDAYYWEFADCWEDPFSAEQVFAYTVKLLRLYRSKHFSAKGEMAKANFEELIHDLKERRSSPKMPVI